jgi:hypothetical protein
MTTPPDFTSGQILTAAQMNAIGRWKMTPTSISGTGATIDADGTINLVGTSAFTVNGCFTSDFKQYEIIARLKTAAGGCQLQMQMTTGGTPATAADYYFTVGYTSYAGAWAKTANNAVFMQFGNSFNTFGSLVTADISYPQQADYTLMTTNSNGWGGAGDEQAITWNHHRLATAYDGFKMTPSSSTLTGELRIYGYN